jgi:hypothetical protein
MSEGWWLARPLGRLMTYIYVPGPGPLGLQDGQEHEVHTQPLLFNYITLEEIVLEATGAVAETAHTLLATSHFMSEQENSFQELEVMKNYDLTII